MTLNELRYIVAVARERHFGRAADACHISQPTLSVAVRKLEDELGVTLFERTPGEITPTPVGWRIVEQAQRVLEEAATVKQLASQGQDELAGMLRLGVIYTIGPYLLPHLIPRLRRRAPHMPLQIEENYTAVLNERLKDGELDVLILSLPFEGPGICTKSVYDRTLRRAGTDRPPLGASRMGRCGNTGPAGFVVARPRSLLSGSGSALLPGLQPLECGF
jgi:LysR family hydrogen peroxide-inducible transcriptional activator